jgi:uncharacterized protein
MDHYVELELRVADLLSSNAAVDEASFRSRAATLFLVAARHNYIDLVKELVDRGTDVQSIDKSTTDGLTALHYAARDNSCELAELLIDANANINATDTYNRTPLHYAAHTGHQRIAALLIEKRANIDLQTIGLKTALDFAIDRGHTNVANQLRARSAAVCSQAIIITVYVL